jgi:glycerol-1-phosphate dehydrogenase [NAD(P)+]
LVTTWPAVIRGAGVLGRESAGWGDFGVVTTASPWELARSMLASAPHGVVTVESLERGHLEELAEALAGVELVVGVGSGLAIDGAKYVAWRTGARLVQAPSTSSNNAAFTRACGSLEKGRRSPLTDGPLPERVLIDEELIARAPARLNRAGVGDVLSSHTALVDWELAHRTGREVDWDVGVGWRAREELARLERLAGAIGADELGAFVELLDIGERLGRDIVAYPRARFNAASEHLFAWCLEERTGRRLVHGEAVCLGVLLMAHIQGNAPERAAEVVRAARVSFHPEEIGTSWSQVEGAVLALTAYAREVVPWHTIVDEVDREPGRLVAAFAEARAFVQGLG